MILKAYNSSRKGNALNEIDHELLNHVVLHIHANTSTDGSILVFLPGFDDIIKQMEFLENKIPNNNYALFMLHSGITSASEQSSIFDRMPNGTRKIILSTNIAETSITIEDVV